MGFHQRNRGAFTTGARGTSDTVQISIATARHIEVKDVADVRNVDTARGNIGSNQYVYAAFGQAFNRFVTLALYHLTFEIAVVDACFAQPVCQLMHTLTLTHKHN